MGITLPPEPQEDKLAGDSRQRALWALEGKKSVGPSMLNMGFAKVEIPEWNTPTGEKEGFSWSPTSPLSSSGKSSVRPPVPFGAHPVVRPFYDGASRA